MGELLDFTGFDEYDPDSEITVTSTSITAGAQAEGSVKKYLGFEFNAGLKQRFSTSVTSVASDGGAGVWASTDETGEAGTWTEGLIVYWNVSSGTPTLNLKDIGEDNTDTSSSLSASTTYYCEVFKHWEKATLKIYSDLDYSTLVDTLTITTDSMQRSSTVYSYFAYGTYDTPDFSEPCDSTAGYTPIGSVTVDDYDTDGKGDELFKGNPVEGTYCRLARDIGTFGDNSTFIWESRYNELGSYAGSGNTTTYVFYDAPDRIVFKVYTDKITNTTGAGTDDQALTTENNIWYTWKIEVDWDGNTYDVYRKAEDEDDFTHIHQYTSLNTTGSADGLIYIMYDYWASGEDQFHQYMNYFNAWEDGKSVTTDSVPVIVGNLETFAIERTGYNHLQKALTFDLTDDFANISSWTTQNTDGSNACAASNNTVVYNGTASMYQTFTPASSPIANYLAFEGQFEAFDVGQYKFLGGSRGSSGYQAQAVIRRIGSKYYAGLRMANTGGDGYMEAWGKKELSVDTDYVFEIGQGNETTFLLIDGQLICHNDKKGTSCGAVDRVFFGDYSGTDYNDADNANDVTINYVRFLKSQAYYHGSSLIIAPNGDLVMGTRQSDEHSFVDTSGKAYIMKSADSGVTWTLEQSIDNASSDDGFGNGHRGTSINDNMMFELRSGTFEYWGSEDNGDTWSELTSNEEQDDYFEVDGEPTEHGGTYGRFVEFLQHGGDWGYWEYQLENWGGDYSSSNVCVAFRSIEDWSKTTGSEICGHGEDGQTGFDPNETAMFRIPDGLTNAGRLIAIVRWDDMNNLSTQIPYCTWYYSDSSNADLMTTGAGQWTYGGDLKGDPYNWGYMSGAPKGVVVGDYLLIHGRIQDSDKNVADTLLKVSLADDDFLQISKSYVWSYGKSTWLETGNPSVVADPDNPNKVYVVTSAGTTQFYDFTLEYIPPPLTEGPLPIYYKPD